jgi:hypothetical protein
MIHTKIISLFPGFDRDNYIDTHSEECLKLDLFSFKHPWRDERECSNYLENYIEAIQNNIGKIEFIIVDASIDVRKILEFNCIFYYLVFPAIQRKFEFIGRFIEKKYDDNFIVDYESHWNEYIKSMLNENINHCNVLLTINDSMLPILTRIKNLN